MYTAQTTISRIVSMISERGYSQKSVFESCGINENTVKRMTDNKGISSFYLAKIADYLDCSVDYLLGRTDIPDIENDNDAQLFNLLKGLSDVDKADFIVAIKQKLSAP